MKKRTLIGITLGTSLLATMAFGGMSFNKTYAVKATDEHDHTGWTGVSELPTDPGNYSIYLTSDVTLTESWNVPEGETNLCLNGHVIDANNGDFNSITIGDDATLNLYDCGSESHNGYIDSDGVWHLGTGEGIQKSITGGIITGANKQSGSGYGGAINNMGSLNMYGGNIVGNLSTKTGAGIYSNGNLNIFSGNIIYNKTTSQGGGVSIGSNPNNTFNMYGGNIDYNIANIAGGVFINRAEVRLSGGTIMNNIATSSYGGMMVSPNVFSIILGGSLNVSGNIAGIGDNKANSNACLTGAGKVFNIGNKTELDEGNGVLCPTDEMYVGVTLGSKDGQFTNKGVPDLSANFFSDDNSYYVVFDNDGTEETADDFLKLSPAPLSPTAASVAQEIKTMAGGWDNEVETANCSANYKAAKALVLSLGADELAIFQTSTDIEIASARATYEHWCEVNGDNSPYESAAAESRRIIKDGKSDAMILGIVVIVSVSTISGYFFLRRKRKYSK